MVNEVELVMKSISGDNAAFAEIVKIYQKRVFGFIKSKVYDSTEVEDLVQESFLSCYSNLKYIRKPESFSLWLFRICQNCVNSYYQRKSKQDLVLEEYDQIEDRNQLESEWEGYSKYIKLAILKLSNEMKEVISFRYFSNMSYSEISSIANIPLKKVKSRLYEAKKILKQSLPNLYHGEEIPQKKLDISMEEIMNKIDIIKKGEYVIKSLSLEDQIHLCELASKNEKFDSQILSSLGRIDGGKEFTTICEGRLLFKDIISILTYARDLEAWIIKNMEKKSPELAEKYKMNMFVFEDLVLLHPNTVKKIVSFIDPEIMLSALVACGVRVVKQYVSSFIDEEIKDKFTSTILNQDMKEEDLKSANFEVIQTLYNMVQKGEIEVAPPTKEIQADIDSYLLDNGIDK